MCASEAGAGAGAGARVVLGSPNPALELTVIGSDFRPVASGVGALEADLQPGFYQIVLRAGPTVGRRLISLGPGEVHTDRDLSLAFPSAAPVAGTSTTHEYHQAVATEASGKALAAAPGQGWLVVVIRDVRGTAGPALDPGVVGRLQLLDRRLEPVPGFAGGWEVHGQEAIAAWSNGLAAGPYVLRTRRGAGQAGQVDQSLWLQDGWQTIVFLAMGADGPDPGSASIHMAATDEQWTPYDERLGQAVELAGWALREGRGMVPADLVNLMLHSKFRNPMLGLIGACASLLRPDPSHAFLQEVLENLGRMIPGHPDLAALSWAVAERFATGPADSELRPAGVGSVEWPPMLTASYQVLIRMDARDPGAIRDGSLAEAIAANLTLQGIWTAWTPVTAPPEASPPPPESADEVAAAAEWQPEISADRVLPDLAPSIVGLSRRKFHDPATARVARYLANVAELEGSRWAGARFREITTAELALATQLPSTRVDRSVRELRLLALTEEPPPPDGGGQGGGGGSGTGPPVQPPSSGGLARWLLGFVVLAVLVVGGTGAAWALGAFGDGPFAERAAPTPSPSVTPSPTPSAEPIAILEVEQPRLDFGAVTIGFEQRLSLDVRNVGNAPLGRPRFLVRSGEFQPDGQCGPLAPGGLCSLDVRFVPDGLGDRNAILAVEADGVPSVGVPLFGVGAPEGGLAFEPPEVSFDLPAGDLGYGTWIVTDGPVRIVGISLGGQSPDLYRIGDPPSCRDQLGPGEPCFLPVEHTALPCEGRFEAELIVLTAGGQRYSIALSATNIC